MVWARPQLVLVRVTGSMACNCLLTHVGRGSTRLNPTARILEGLGLGRLAVQGCCHAAMGWAVVRVPAPTEA